MAIRQRVSIKLTSMIPKAGSSIQVRRNKVNKSFTGHIALVFITLNLFVIAALTTVSYLITRSYIENHYVNQYISNQTELIVNKIESFTKPLISLAGTMASSQYNINWIKNEQEQEDLRVHFEKQQKNLIKYHHLTSTFLVSLLTNNIYINGVSDGAADLTGRDAWIIDFLETGEDYQLKVDYNRNQSEELFLIINYRIKDYEDRTIGIAGIVMKMDNILEIFNDRHLNNTGYYFAINRDGQIQMHPVREWILEENISTLDEHFPKPEFSNGNDFFISRYTSRIDHEDYFLVARELPEIDWIIVGKLSVNECFSLLSTILRSSVLIALIMITISLLITYLISNRFKYRIGEMIKNMTKFMSYISKDVKADHIELRRSRILDELGNLSNEICDSADYVKKIMEIQHSLQDEIKQNSKEISEKNERLQTLSNQTIYALANAIDAKDSYTRGHSLRVAKYSKELARRLGKTEAQQNEIYNVALLHDVGKIAIPDTIINKTTKLTDEEFALIKSHTSRGYEILKDITVMPNLYVGARWHHERFDGKGYPDGKAGEEIPLIARVICVADCYDAMTSDRSYRKALPQAVVRSEIEKNMGTQFDPKIARLMLQMIDDDLNYSMKSSTPQDSEMPDLRNI